jgi:hypothetical protein
MSAPSQIDDRTAEALLTGRPVPPALEPLTGLLAAYRRAAAGAPVPASPELAARMAAGQFPPAPATGSRAGGNGTDRGHQAPARDGRRRRRMPAVEVLAGVAAKLTGMSVAAKALAGVALATASVGTAGQAGALPDPAQERFETVVETVTPLDVPAPAGENAEFGERVSEDAKDGGVDGGEISEEARQQGDRHRPAELPAPGEPGGPDDPGAPDDPGMPTELPTPGEPGPPDSPPDGGDRPTPPGR